MSRKVALLLSLAVLGGLASCGNQEEVAKLEEELAAAEGLAAGFKSERNAAKAEVKQLQRRVSGLRVQIADLQIILDNQQAQIDSFGDDYLEGPMNCAPGYDQCLDPAVSDYDCASGIGDGPFYVEGPIGVTGDDPYGLDGDFNGVGCEGSGE